MSSQHTITLLLTLQDDTIFADSGATEGGLQTLRYVPGASIWGALASRLYKSFQARDFHHAAFHHDRIRCLDGLPVGASGYPGLPAPGVWHRRKTDGAGDCSGENSILNLARRGPEHGVQRKSMRNVSICGDGSVVDVFTTQVLKTAMEPGMERARNSQLFNYTALRAGQQFIAHVQADSDLDADIWDAVKSELKDTVLRLGRSRSAQFGRVHCQEVPERSIHHGWPVSDSSVMVDGRQRLTFWCVSDAGLYDEFGHPTVSPSPSQFGLDPRVWQYRAAASAVEIRRYSPFNGYRKSHDSERLLLRRGSVLSFDAVPGETLLDTAALSALREKLSTGIGLYRGSGCGQVVVQPAWAQTEFVVFTTGSNPLPLAQASRRPDPVEPSAAEKHFLQWLQERAGQGVVADDRAAQIAQQISVALRSTMQQATKLSGGNAALVTPTRSQWGQLQEAGKTARTLDEVLLALAQGPLEGALEPEGCKLKWPHAPDARGKKNKIWFQPAFADGKPSTLGDHLIALLVSHLCVSTARPGAVLAKLANVMRNAENDATQASKESA